MRRLLLASLLSLSVMPAWAAETVPFTQAAFQQAEAQNKPILVAIHASWCPVCAKQAPIIARLEAEPAYKGVVVMRVDFDSQKDVVRDFKANMQSTLVAFHGKEETGRAVGVTDEAAIKSLFDKTKG